MVERSELQPGKVLEMSDGTERIGGCGCSCEGASDLSFALNLQQSGRDELSRMPMKNQQQACAVH